MSRDRVRLDPHRFRTATSLEGRYTSGSQLGLALGGGFARGLAHIGVLQVLEENGVAVSCISGSSVGSILGAAYASGIPLKRIADVCRKVQFRDFARWKLTRMGLASNDRLAHLIETCFHKRTFEDLRIPMAVVATDLEAGEPVVFTKGDLVTPIRASCAFPGLFEPVEFRGRCLADGALSSPVPTEALSGLGARHVLAVSVGFNNWHAGPPTNLFRVVSRAISIAQKHGAQEWRSLADVVLEPHVKGFEWDDFHRADECIAAGAEAMRRAMPRLEEILQQPDTRFPKYRGAHGKPEGLSPRET